MSLKLTLNLRLGHCNVFIKYFNNKRKNVLTFILYIKSRYVFIEFL